MLTCQNPTDWKHIQDLSPPGSIAGCDYSGTVVVPSKLFPSLKVGTKVAGFVHGGKFPDRGAYAEYTKVKGDMVQVLPENTGKGGWKMEEAASLGIGYITASRLCFTIKGTNTHLPRGKGTTGYVPLLSFRIQSSDTTSSSSKADPPP